MGGWRKLNNEELRDLYSSPSIIRIIKWRRMRWVGHVAELGRPRCRWVDNIWMELGEVGWGEVAGLFWFNIQYTIRRNLA
jgi:hypothetical protein